MKKTVDCPMLQEDRNAVGLTVTIFELAKTTTTTKIERYLMHAVNLYAHFLIAPSAGCGAAPVQWFLPLCVFPDIFRKLSRVFLAPADHRMVVFLIRLVHSIAAFCFVAVFGRQALLSSFHCLNSSRNALARYF